MTYSPWVNAGWLLTCDRRECRRSSSPGGETDVCVLATVLGAIDFGFHVIVLSDAVCSGTDETHDAAVDLLSDRFSVQLKLLETDAFLCSILQQK